jgi:hypothetical protein
MRVPDHSRESVARSDRRPVPERIAKLSEPRQSSVFEDGFGEAYWFVYLGTGSSGILVSAAGGLLLSASMFF